MKKAGFISLKWTFFEIIVLACFLFGYDARSATTVKCDGFEISFKNDSYSYEGRSHTVLVFTFKEKGRNFPDLQLWHKDAVNNPKLPALYNLLKVKLFAPQKPEEIFKEEKLLEKINTEYFHFVITSYGFSEYDFDRIVSCYGQQRKEIDKAIADHTGIKKGIASFVYDNTRSSIVKGAKVTQNNKFAFRCAVDSGIKAIVVHMDGTITGFGQAVARGPTVIRIEGDTLTKAADFIIGNATDGGNSFKFQKKEHIGIIKKSNCTNYLNEKIEKLFKLI